MKHAVTTTPRHLLPLLLGMLLSLWSFPMQAADDDQGIDIVFIMDSSGSMKQNDAQRLRVQAGKMFLNLLDQRDRAAIISFSGKAYRVTPLLSLKTTVNENRLLKGIDKIGERGAFTNIYDALDQGHKLLAKNRQKGRKQHIVLMSDGNMDVGHKETDLRLTEKTLEDIGPKLAKSRIKVHTITFNQSSNLPLMRLVANDTRGTFSILKNSAEIHDVFSRIFERSKFPDMLPINEDSFIVDDNISEFTVLVSKYKPTSRIALENPDGDELNADTKHRDVRWYRAKKFDMITVRNPISGYWLVKYSEGGNKAYIITDLKLRAEASSEIAKDTPLLVRTWLEKGDKLLRRHTLVNASQFKLRVTDPNGKVKEYAIVDDGIDGDDVAGDGYYHRQLNFAEAGDYKLEAIVTGETFDRTKTLFVKVKSFVADADPFAVQDAATLTQPETSMATPTTPELVSKVEPTPTVKEASTTVEIKTEKKAEITESSATETEDKAAPTEVKTEEESHENKLIGSILIFVLINVIIGSFVAAYVFIKRQKKKAREAEMKANEQQIELDENAETDETAETESATNPATDLSATEPSTEMADKQGDT